MVDNGSTDGAVRTIRDTQYAIRDMEFKLILAGIGGQGVIFATKVLAHAAVARGLLARAEVVARYSLSGTLRALTALYAA